jgi:hypothetical protein
LPASPSTKSTSPWSPSSGLIAVVISRWDSRALGSYARLKLRLGQATFEKFAMNSLVWSIHRSTLKAKKLKWYHRDFQTISHTKSTTPLPTPFSSLRARAARPFAHKNLEKIWT